MSRRVIAGQLATDPALQVASDEASPGLRVTHQGSGNAIEVVDPSGAALWSIAPGGSSPGASSNFMGIPVCSAYATAAEKSATTAAGGYICDGVADQVEINQAITDLKSRTPANGVAGGLVQLIGPFFSISNTITLKSYVWVNGQGWFYTKLRSANTWAGAALSGMVESDNTGGTTATEYWKLSNLCLDAAKSAQTLTSVYGIKDQVDATTGFTYNDSMHTVEFVRIIDTLTDAWVYQGTNQRAGRFGPMRIERPDGYGLNTNAADSHFHNIDIGSAGNAGYFLNGATNHRFTNSKAYFCGRLVTVPTSTANAVLGAGWKINGPRNSFSSCEAQDCTGHGFAIGSNHNTLSACIADSNSWRTANANVNSADGFSVSNDVHYVTIDGWAIDKNEANRGVAMRNGVKISASGPLSSDLIIDVQVDNALSGPVAYPTGIVRSRINVGGSTSVARGSVTTTAASAAATLNSTAAGAFAIGQYIENSNIPTGTTIANLVGSAITLSGNANTSATSTSTLGKTKSVTGGDSGGTSTQTPGAVSTVTIAHNLGAAPTAYAVTAGDANARGAPTMHVTVDATNITLNFSVALTAATAYTWVWTASVLPN